MTDQPYLSICVPSRNRQPYFQETVRALTRSPRSDVEFVFADNSDDPAEMIAFIRQFEGDSRVRFVPAEKKIHSMSDNWNRAMAAATGRWVSFIGDDDYVDPEVALLLSRIEATGPDVQAVAWNRLTYDWPGTKAETMVTAVATGCRIVEVSRDELMRKIFGWEGAGRMPVFMFSVYHAAVRRDLVEENRARYGGVYFEHPNPDQDSALKVIFNARRFIFSERPFSVLGACPTSNSAALGRVDTSNKRHAEFMSDLGRNMDEDPHMRDFPFLSIFGATASAACSQNWFKKTYGVEYEGWEANFARSCAFDCMGTSSLEDFETMRENYARAFAGWKGGRFLKDFNPVFHPREARPKPKATGITKLLVYLEEMVGGAETPADLYDVAAAMMTPASEIPVDAAKALVSDLSSVRLGQGAAATKTVVNKVI